MLKRSILVSTLVATFVLMSLVGSAMAASGEVLVLHFDEGYGTIARDSSGYGNDGTIYGATWVEGISGKALRFDGVDDYVGVPLKESFTNDLTIEFWMKNTVKTSYQQRIVDLGSYSSTGFQLCEWIDGAIIIDNSGGPTGNVKTQRPYNDGSWHHVAGVRQGNEYRLYVDGTYVGSIAGTIPSYDYAFIGRRAFIGVGSFFDGVVDEISIYNRALSVDEIKAHYEGKKPAITLTKSATPSTIQEGETTTIAIRVENTGTGDAKAVEVTDAFPVGFKIISGSKTESFSDIKSGDYRALEYTLKATGSGKFTCDPATATYKDADGNSYSAASNSVTLQVDGEVPVGADSDGDGWSDEKEREMGTNPYSVDSDSDGLKDPEDPNPTVPEGKKGIPGFEAIFALAGVLAVAHLVRRREVIK